MKFLILTALIISSIAFIVTIFLGIKNEREFWYGTRYYYHKMNSLYKLATFLGMVVIILFWLVIK